MPVIDLLGARMCGQRVAGFSPKANSIPWKVELGWEGDTEQTLPGQDPPNVSL